MEGFLDRFVDGGLGGGVVFVGDGGGEEVFVERVGGGGRIDVVVEGWLVLGMWGERVIEVVEIGCRYLC